jgi:hypothetical protein
LVEFHHRGEEDNAVHFLKSPAPGHAGFSLACNVIENVLDVVVGAAERSLNVGLHTSFQQVLVG